jgi:hypothetical protein
MRVCKNSSLIILQKTTNTTMFSSFRILLSSPQSELKITVQPTDKSSVAGTASLSVSAATKAKSIKYKWVKYVGGVGNPITVFEEIK